jgi:hypothetical protein
MHQGQTGISASQVRENDEGPGVNEAVLLLDDFDLGRFNVHLPLGHARNARPKGGEKMRTTE